MQSWTGTNSTFVNTFKEAWFEARFGKPNDPKDGAEEKQEAAKPDEDESDFDLLFDKDTSSEEEEDDTLEPPKKRMASTEEQTLGYMELIKQLEETYQDNTSSESEPDKENHDDQDAENHPEEMPVKTAAPVKRRNPIMLYSDEE